MDFRAQPREGFIRWYQWSLEQEDCDPALFMLKYLFKRYDLNIEQKLWICWLYGTTYYAPTAWVIWNEFPDMELVGVQRLEEWNSKNYRRLRYQTDTRYNKGHLPTQFSSYKDWLGGLSQREKISSILAGKSGEEGFAHLWGEVSGNLHKFGRYSTWFYLQTLRKCAGVPIEAPSLLLEDYGGSRSHRNGLCLALGKPEWYDQKLSASELSWMQNEAQSILQEVRRRNSALDAEFFGMESCLCSYKKAFRQKDGRYLGYYLDRQSEEISTVQNDGWAGIDWRPWWEGRSELLHPSLAKSTQIRKELMVSGQFSRFGLTSEEDVFDFWG